MCCIIVEGLGTYLRAVLIDILALMHGAYPYFIKAIFCKQHKILKFTFSDIAKRYAASLSVQSPSRKLYVFVPAIM